MTDGNIHRAWRLSNLRRRVRRARKFPTNTCGASRHLHIIAEALAVGRPYPMLHEEPEHCASSMLAVLECLWKARTRLQRVDPKGEARRNATTMASIRKRLESAGLKSP